MSKRGQVTVFIILAVVLVASVALYFVFRDSVSTNKVPAEFESVYTNFLNCLESDVLEGVDLLETQGGYINLPDFEAGSAHSPFSSQLNFLGNPIPYWYYVSGNNLPKVQVPSKSDLESELELFVEARFSDCSFESYYDEGFGINFDEGSRANIDINEGEVRLSLDSDMEMEFSENSVVVDEHNVVVKTKLGELYESAREIYDLEQENLFLETYAIDNLRLYAPVDGVEFSCSPKIWNADEVFDELQDAIEINTLSLENNPDDYFDVDLPGVKNEVRFLNSKTWPSNFEVNPSEENLLISKPVGNQAGLGVLGFCYLSHHYVYNVKYPVLVQVYDSSDASEIFQFPLAVVLEGNVPRESLEVVEGVTEVQDIGLCKNKNTLTKVNTYDSNLNPVDADISYECFGSVCSIGESSSGVLESDFPQCANGQLIVRADGYLESRETYSSVNTGTINVVLDKVYGLGVDLNVDGLGLSSEDGEAIINFVSEDYSTTVIYPSERTVELVEGDYEISVYVYGNSEIEVPESSYEQCIEVPRGSIGGILGLTREECFDVDAPSRIISDSLSAGGTENYYIPEFELQGSRFIEINSDSLKTPGSLEDLQENYLIFETKGLEVSFR